MVDDLNRRLERLRPLFAQDARIVAVYLFGSQVDGYALPWSDVDLAVLWGEPVTFRTRLALEAQICIALEIDQIDLLDLGQAPLPLRHRVISTGTLLYEAAPEQLSDFIEETMLLYFDLLPRLEAYHRDFLHSLEADYGH